MVNIVFITDEEYVVITGVAITSLKLNHNKKYNYKIYVVAVDLQDENIKKIESIGEEGFEIIVVKPQKRYIEYKQARGTFTSKASYARFYLAEILPELDKVIYLDDDIIVQQDLMELDQIPLEDYYCIASRDMYLELMVPSIIERWNASFSYCFNAGVMVLNLKKMRENNISERLMEYRKNGLNYGGNQDAFNMVFAGNVKYISGLWNYLSAYQKMWSTEVIANFFSISEDVDEGGFLRKAKILHFAGKEEKVWKDYQYYLTELYMSYYERSPFKDVGYFCPYHLSKNDVLYLFPFDKINKGDRIILYGAGKIGKCYYSQIQKTGYCQVVQWVDSYWKTIESNVLNGVKIVIENPGKIASMKEEYDFCVIAVLQENIYEQIENDLIAMGVSREKIIWSYPRYSVE